jgi:hypothetical protein
MKLREFVEVMNTNTKLIVVVRNFPVYSLEHIFDGFETTISECANPEMLNLLRTHGDMYVQNISARNDRNGLAELLVLVGDEEHYHVL